MTSPRSRSALLAEILSQARVDARACVQDHTLKALAWAYVHGAKRGSDDEKTLEQLLVAKAKEF